MMKPLKGLGMLLALATATAGSSGCGPMNSRPPGAPGAVAGARYAGAAADPGDGSAVFMTDGSFFVVSAHLAALQGSGSQQSPKTGNLVVRALHGKGLEPLSSQAGIQVTYRRESSHSATHDPYPLAVTPQSDGSYVGGFSVTRTGTYDFKIDLQDQGDHDAHTFSLKIQ